MSETQSPVKSSARIPELDGIRGVAILLVLIWHYFVCQWRLPDAPLAFKALLLCWSGVDLFFVLSGFLIGGILIDNKQSSSYFQTFYIRRCCRIFPLYYAALAAYFVIAAILSSQGLTGIFDLPSRAWPFFTYTQNFFMGWQSSLTPHPLGVTWSLAIEEQFYFFLPLLIFVLPRRAIPWALAFLILIAPAVRILLYDQSIRPGFYSFIMMPGRMDSLLLGAFAAHLFRNEGARHFIQKYNAWIYPVLAVIFIGLMRLCFDPRNFAGQLTDLISWEICSYGYTLLAFLYFGILLLALTEKKGPVSMVARWRPLQQLGIVAYGVYIYHESVSALVHGIFRHQIPQINNGMDMAATAVSLVLTILIAHWSWIYFEKKIVVWGHRFNYRAGT